MAGTPAKQMNITQHRKVNSVVMLVLLGLVGLAAGCSGEKQPEQPRTKYYAAILLAAKTTKSDFQRKMLKDGVVTRAEYEDAINATAKCMDDRGHQLGKTLQNGVYTLSVVTSDAADKALTDCQDVYSLEVAAFFGDQLRNPDGRDGQELLIECFIHRSVVPPTYTVADFRQEFAKDFKNTPINFDSPEAELCMNYPARR